MDIKTAYQIMGIPEDATIDELEKQYMLWIKKEKAQRDQGYEGPHSKSDSINMDKITEAYHLINYPDSNFRSEEESIEKISFLSFYKYYAIGILFLILVVGYSVYNFIDHRIEQAAIAKLPTPDFEVLIMGDFDFDEENIPRLEEEIKGEFPEWENIKINFKHSFVDAGVEMDYATRPALLMTLSENKPDLYLVDEQHYDILFGYELLAPINISEDLAGKEGENSLRYNQLDGESEQLFGVDLAGSAIFGDIEVGNDEVIAAIRDGSSNQENALQFIKQR